MQCADLEQALELAKELGLPAEWRVFHFPSTVGTYANPKNVIEVLVRKVNSLLTKLPYNNDLHKLLTQVTAWELLDPLTETIAGRAMRVSLIQLQRYFNGSPYAMLQAFLRATGRSTIADAFRPFHVAGAPKGIFADVAVRDELLEKKIDQLRMQLYGGRYLSLIQGTKKEELATPFVDELLGREVAVSVATLVDQFNCSPFAMLKAYLQIKGKTELAEKLRPYHLLRSSKDTFADPNTVDDLIEKKLDSVCQSKFGGDIHRLITEAGREELFSPLIERIGSMSIIVSLFRVATICNGSPFIVIQRYLRKKGLHEMADAMRPEHLRVASRNTYSEEKIDELLLKKVDQLLAAPPYNGDLKKLLTSGRQQELFAPFLDDSTSPPTEVSMGVVQNALVSSTFRLLQRYLILKNCAELSRDFRTFHLAESSRGAYSDSGIVDEVLRKKIDIILTETYGGDIHRMATSVSAIELLSPFVDDLCGYPVVVSMGGVGNKFSQSPYLMLKRYFEIIGKTELSDQFRPYHLAKPPQGVFNDQVTVDELLHKRVKDLLSGELYGRDFGRFIRDVRTRDILAPFTDYLVGNPVEVSLAGLWVRFDHSLHKLLSRFARIDGQEFPYSPTCFVGSSDTRARRLDGKFSKIDLKNARRPDGTFDLSIFGFKQFNGPEKEAVRLLTVEHAASFIGDSEVRYLGLETEALRSLRVVARLMDLASTGSTIVEREPRVFNAIISRAEFGSAEDQKLLNACNVIQGDIIQSIKRDLDGQFEIVNLDFVGQLSSGKIDAIQGLIERGLLAKRSAIFVTLADDGVHRKRALTSRFEGPQASAFLNSVRPFFGSRYLLHDAVEIPYRGGTSQGRQCDMVTIVLSIEEKPSTVASVVILTLPYNERP